MQPNDKEQALQRIKVEKHGLYLSRDAAASGFSPPALARYNAATGAKRVSRGLFRDPAFLETPEQQILGPCMLIGEASASRWSSAWLHDVDGVFPGKRPVIAVPSGTHHTTALAHVHQVAGLTPEDRTVVRGVPTLTPEATLVTLAAVMREDRLEEVLVDLLCRRLLTVESTAAVLERLARSGRNGVVVLRRVIGRWDGRRTPDSVKEFQLLKRLVEAGMPEPVMQYRIERLDGTLIATVDLAYPEWRVAIEYQSDKYHSTPKAKRADYRRALRIQAEGWSFLPASQDDINDVRPLIRAIHASRRLAA